MHRDDGRRTNVKTLAIAPCICGREMRATRLIELLRLQCECGVRFEPLDKGITEAAARWNELRNWGETK